MLLRVIDAAANYYMQSIGHIMGSQLETDMRHDIFHHLQELSFGYYSDTKVGQIMARITSGPVWKSPSLRITARRNS